VAILTNGTLLKPMATTGALARIRAFEYRISLDGFTSHDHLRSGSSHLDILAGIQELEDRGYKYSVNTMIHAESIEDVPRLYGTMKTTHTQAWRLDFLFDAGRQRTAKEETAPDLDSFYRTIVPVVRDYIQTAPDFSLEVAHVFKPSLLNRGFYRFDLVDHPCSYHMGSMGVRSNGDIVFCPSLKIPFGNVTNMTLADAAGGAAFRDFRTTSVGDIETCRGCRYLRLCGTGCPADALYSTGHLWRRDSMACRHYPRLERYIVPLLPESSRDSFVSCLDTAPGSWTPAE